MPATVSDASVPTAPRPQDHDGARPPAGRDREDRCPGLLRPHEAADGLLIRVRLIGGRLGDRAVAAIAGAARHGNGIVELTSRANVQVRGVRAAALADLSAAFLDAGLLRSAAHDRARNVAADPLAGRRPGALAGPVEVEALLDALDDGLCADSGLAALPGRFLLAVEDGSGFGPDPAADVRILAGPGGAWSIAVAGRTVTAAPTGDAAAAALDLARAFLRCGGGARAWRIAELPGGAQALRDAVGAGTGMPVAAPREGDLVGAHVQADGRVAVGALAPLGRLPLGALDVLGALVADHPVRVSGRRTVAVLDVPADAAEKVADRLEAAGLVTAAGSGWEDLTACAGTGACARALADVRAAAARSAAQRGRGAPREHWSACARRCGQTAAVRRAVVARPEGGWHVEEVAA